MPNGGGAVPVPLIAVPAIFHDVNDWLKALGDISEFVEEIKNDLTSTLLRTGREQLSEIVGADAATITAEEWPI